VPEDRFLNNQSRRGAFAASRERSSLGDDQMFVELRVSPGSARSQLVSQAGSLSSSASQSLSYPSQISGAPG